MSETFTTYGIGPDKQFDDLQTLRDERDRLARVLEGLSSIIPHQHCRTCNQYADEIKAALTPAGGGQK